MVEPDILHDTATELLARGLDRETVQRALSEIRRRYGGSETYVMGIDRAARDQAARAALARGASIQEAARAAGCSPSTIRRRRSDWQ
jgi:hypothetical protein